MEHQMFIELQKMIPFREIMNINRGKWFALSGDRLELEDSGIAIRLTNNPRLPLYELIAPDGRTLGYHMDLNMMKNAAEQLQRDLNEFRPT